jgi:hypothetical protein
VKDSWPLISSIWHIKSWAPCQLIKPWLMNMPKFKTWKQLTSWTCAKALPFCPCLESFSRLHQTSNMCFILNIIFPNLFSASQASPIEVVLCPLGKPSRISSCIRISIETFPISNIYYIFKAFNKKFIMQI